MTRSSALNAFLADLRQHPLFPELLKAIPEPQLPRYRQSRSDKIEAERARWIFQSGAISQHEAWMAFLTGQAQPSQEDRE